MEWKVMTFNLRVHLAPDGDNSWEYRYEAAAKAVERSGADLVCTQEATFSMLRELEPLLPQYAWVGEGRSGGRDDEYCAIFYARDRLELMECGHFGLSEYPERLGFRSWETACPRMCTWARFQARTGEERLVFNTHLDHISEEARVQGIRLIARRMQEERDRTGLQALLAGDFNTVPESEPVRVLEQLGYRSAYAALPGGVRQAGGTFHGFKGEERGEPIDYLFVTPDTDILSVEIDRSKIGGRYPSDHYPVIARLSHSLQS